MPHAEISFPFAKRSHYPHLSPEDTAIWERFIEANPGKFDHVYYDFRVGDEDPVPDDLPVAIRQAWWDLSYWRIDTVGEDAKNFYIIEIKPYANSKAIGQALSYAAIFLTDENPEKPVIPVVLTDVIFPTTQRVADLLNVQIWKS